MKLFFLIYERGNNCKLYSTRCHAMRCALFYSNRLNIIQHMFNSVEAFLFFFLGLPKAIISFLLLPMHLVDHSIFTLFSLFFFSWEYLNFQFPLRYQNIFSLNYLKIPLSYDATEIPCTALTSHRIRIAVCGRHFTFQLDWLSVMNSNFWPLILSLFMAMQSDDRRTDGMVC